ncbi:phosphotransferase enzyme family protein [Paenibacillus illinoisensis]|uniref:Phosphotransferase enzyme family protein n=1 Tax=Paenibacillus illinoisensis TaxID=59845 RepID=A0ABW8I0Q4_9BACL
MITTDRERFLDNLVKDAITRYPLRKPSASFIRHNENLTYRIMDEASGQKYLLRIHKAAYASMTGIQHTRPALEAEMSLLHELKSSTGLRVQKPVRNSSGDWVTVCFLENGEEICCTMLEWIEGRDIQQGEQLTTEQIHDLGMQMQTLHQYGRVQDRPDTTNTGSEAKDGWTGQNEVRPSYGSIKENLNMLGQLEEGVRLGVFTPEDFALIRETFGKINNQLEAYPIGPETWGVIHGDITRGNLLVTEQGISMIDFCLYGYGYYLFDAAGAALIFHGEERDIFLSGYTKPTAPLTKQEIRLMEGFMLIFTFGYYAFQMANESRHEWMKDRMPKLCSKYCRPYVENHSIFYEL